MTQRRRRPRGHIRELPSGSFQAIAYAGRDPLTGRNRYERETAKTYQAAEVALTRLQNQVDEDRHPKSDLTVLQAIDQWLEVAELEDTTRDRYGDLIRIYIEPSLGAMKAAKLDAELLERWYARLQRCRSACDGRRRSSHLCRPLSSSTVRKIHFVLSAALGRAVRWDHIPVNRGAAGSTTQPGGDRAGPADRCRGRSAAGRGVGHRPGLGAAALADDGDRLPPRRGQRPALAPRRLRRCPADPPPQQRPAQGRAQGEGDQDPPAAPRDARSADARLPDRASRRVRAALCGARGQPGPGRLRILTVSGRVDPMAAAVAHPSIRTVGGQAPPAQHPAALPAALLGHRADRRRHRRPHGRGRLGHGSGGATTLKIYAAWVDEAGQRAATTMAGIMPTIAAPPPRRARGPYEVIATDLREQIEDGRLAPGALVRTTAELATTHGVSIATSHRAIALLAADGLIKVSRGRRAVVAPPPRHTRAHEVAVSGTRQ